MVPASVLKASAVPGSVPLLVSCHRDFLRSVAVAVAETVASAKVFSPSQLVSARSLVTVLSPLLQAHRT